MGAVKTQFERYVGDDFTIPVTIYQADNVSVANITGWSVTFAFHTPTSDIDLVTKTVGSGIVITTPLAGLLTITMHSGDTSDLEPGNYQFRVERTDSGNNDVLVDGVFKLLRK